MAAREERAKLRQFGRRVRDRRQEMGLSQVRVGANLRRAAAKNLQMRGGTSAPVRAKNATLAFRASGKRYRASRSTFGAYTGSRTRDAKPKWPSRGHSTNRR